MPFEKLEDFIAFCKQDDILEKVATLCWENGIRSVETQEEKDMLWRFQRKEGIKVLEAALKQHGQGEKTRWTLNELDLLRNMSDRDKMPVTNKDIEHVANIEDKNLIMKCFDKCVKGKVIELCLQHGITTAEEITCLQDIAKKGLFDILETAIKQHVGGKTRWTAQQLNYLTHYYILTTSDIEALANVESTEVIIGCLQERVKVPVIVLCWQNGIKTTGEIKQLKNIESEGQINILKTALEQHQGEKTRWTIEDLLYIMDYTSKLTAYDIANVANVGDKDFIIACWKKNVKTKVISLCWQYGIRTIQEIPNYLPYNINDQDSFKFLEKALKQQGQGGKTRWTLDDIISLKSRIKIEDLDFLANIEDTELITDCLIVLNVKYKVFLFCWQHGLKTVEEIDQLNDIYESNYDFLAAALEQKDSGGKPRFTVQELKILIEKTTLPDIEALEVVENTKLIIDCLTRGVEVKLILLCWQHDIKDTDDIVDLSRLNPQAVENCLEKDIENVDYIEALISGDIRNKSDYGLSDNDFFKYILGCASCDIPIKRATLILQANAIKDRGPTAGMNQSKEIDNFIETCKKYGKDTQTHLGEAERKAVFENFNAEIQKFENQWSPEKKQAYDIEKNRDAWKQERADQRRIEEEEKYNASRRASAEAFETISKTPPYGIELLSEYNMTPEIKKAKAIYETEKAKEYEHEKKIFVEKLQDIPGFSYKNACDFYEIAVNFDRIKYDEYMDNFYRRLDSIGALRTCKEIRPWITTILKYNSKTSVDMIASIVRRAFDEGISLRTVLNEIKKFKAEYGKDPSEDDLLDIVNDRKLSSYFEDTEQDSEDTEKDSEDNEQDSDEGNKKNATDDVLTKKYKKDSRICKSLLKKWPTIADAFGEFPRGEGDDNLDKKIDYIDAHYEEIALIVDEYEEDGFNDTKIKQTLRKLRGALETTTDKISAVSLHYLKEAFNLKDFKATDEMIDTLNKDDMQKKIKQKLTKALILLTKATQQDNDMVIDKIYKALSNAWKKLRRQVKALPQGRTELTAKVIEANDEEIMDALEQILSTVQI